MSTVLLVFSSDSLSAHMRDGKVCALRLRHDPAGSKVVVASPGFVQRLSTPLLLLIMLMINNRRIMGEQVNGRGLNALGRITTTAICSVSAGWWPTG